jgi:hypothetical protein
MTTSHTETFNLSSQLADLALPHHLDRLLTAALDSPQGEEVRDAVETAITAKIREHGVDTNTGEWLGEWNAEAIITKILVDADVEGTSPNTLGQLATELKTNTYGLIEFAGPIMADYETPDDHTTLTIADEAFIRDAWIKAGTAR